MNGITKVDWNEQFKIRPRRNASKKHEVIKLLIVLNLLEKFKVQKGDLSVFFKKYKRKSNGGE